MLEKERILMDIKTEIAELHNSILNLSAGLWNVSIAIDELLMADNNHNEYVKEYDKFVDSVNNQLADDGGALTPAEVKRANQMYKEQLDYEKEVGQYGNDEPPTIRARGRPRKEAPPEPLQAPAEPEIPETLPPLPPLPPKAPEPKPNIVERLLGKEADQKAKMRAERMAKLEKELAELSKK